MKLLLGRVPCWFPHARVSGQDLSGAPAHGPDGSWPLRRVAVVSLPRFCSFHGSGSNQLGPIYGHTSVTTGSLLDDHHWHSMVIERQGRSINLTLDRGVQHFRTNGEFDYLDLDYEVSCGTRLVLRLEWLPRSPAGSLCPCQSHACLPHLFYSPKKNCPST